MKRKAEHGPCESSKNFLSEIGPADDDDHGVDNIDGDGDHDDNDDEFRWI